MPRSHKQVEPKVAKIKSMIDLHEEYAAMVRSKQAVVLDLSHWLPSLRFDCRPIWPGEVVVVWGDVGTGKTAILQNLARTAAQDTLTCLLYELELPGTICYERFIAMEHGITCSEVQQDCHAGGCLPVQCLGNIYVCDDSQMSMSAIYHTACSLESRAGTRPEVILIDYAALVAGRDGQVGSRYDRVSTMAEDCKILARALNCIVILAAQIHRKEGDDGMTSRPVGLHSGKDSGSLEAVADLLLGIWRPDEDRDELIVKLLKNRKGKPGRTIRCIFDAPKMRISEMREEPEFCDDFVK